jgi:hypothetical protein
MWRLPPLVGDAALHFCLNLFVFGARRESPADGLVDTKGRGLGQRVNSRTDCALDGLLSVTAKRGPLSAEARECP